SDDWLFQAQLFFLTIKATNADNTGPGGMPDGQKTGFMGSIDVDLDHADDMLPITDIGSLRFHPRFGADVQVDLNLEASIADNPELPKITAQLFVDWGFDSGKMLDDPSQAAPIVEINHVTLDLGEFISHTIGPILQDVNKFLDPIRPILKILNTEIPVISQVSQLVGGGPITFIDLIGLLGSGGGTITTVIGILNAIDGFVSQASALGGSDLKIDFGDFNFGDDLRTTAPDQIHVSDSEITNGLNSFEDALTRIAGDATEKATATSFLSSLKSSVSGGLGLDFPLFTHPQNIFKLLLGQPADLVTWDIPRLQADFSFSQLFGPILPPIPLFAKISGSFSIFADFFVGLDTRGLQTHNFLNGFFFGDFRDGSTGPEVPEVGLSLEFKAAAELNVAVAEAGVEGGIRAEITADWHDDDHDGKVYLDELLANLLRGAKCIFDLEGALTAFLDAFVKVGFDTPFGFVTLFEDSFNLLKVTLLDFTVSCPPLPPPQPATLVGDTLFLNIGPRASLRQPGATDGAETVSIRGEADFDNNGVLTQTMDKNGDGKISADELGEDLNNDGVITDDVVAVTGFGVTQIFTGVHHIMGDGGADNDIITLDASVRVPATLAGGAGNDKIQGGSAGDSITGGDGDDQLTGGAGNDVISGNAGNDTIYGNAGSDTLAGGAGDDTIIGGDNDKKDVGDLGDSITGGDGNDKMFGNLGDDTIRGGQGSDTIQGGQGNDSLFGDGDDDTIFGDEGNDTIEGGAGNDSLHGGKGDDKIMGGRSTAMAADPDGNDVIFGDEGHDVLLGDNGVFGSVTLIGGAGNDTLIGGDGNDSLYGQGGNDVLVGDNATIGTDGTVHPDTTGTPGNDYMEGNAGSDTMYGGGGDDKMIGGSSTLPGSGSDAGDLMFGDTGNDILLGDNGTIDITTGEVHTNAAGGAGSDSIFGGVGDDTIFGGGFGDNLVGDGFGGSGNDLIVGDQGSRTATMIVAEHSAVANSSGDDTISASSGQDTVLGGEGADSIAGDDGADILVGDNGKVTLASGVVTRIETLDTGLGGNDTITGGNGDDIILGGFGSDVLTGGGDLGNDIILGDNGVVVRNDGSADANDIFSNSTDGAGDTISGGPGSDTLIGGAGGDSLLGGTGADIILGDHGRITRDASDSVLRIATIFESNGGDDTIDGGADADTVLGGVGNDTINGGTDIANDILLGDNGVVVRNDGSADANDIFSSDPTLGLGGKDTISGGPGDDIIIGGSGGADTTGVGGDSLFGNDGHDIVIGDSARITRNGFDQIEKIETTFPGQGGDDTIQGNAGNDTLLGGFGHDTLTGGTGNDVLLGDNGELDYVATPSSSLLTLITTTNPTLGHSDTLSGGDGNDTILGGTAGDTIDGGNDRDLIFGDHGKVDLTLPSNRNFTSIDTGAADGGGNDTVHGNAGDDTILGGQGADLLFGEGSDDDIIGGHNVAGGADGNDTMDGGTGNDVLLGDNGSVIRRSDSMSPLDRVLTGTTLYNMFGSAGFDAAYPPAVTPDAQLNPTGAVGRDIVIFDHSTTTSAGLFGNDLMAGAGGNDTLFGELGDDTMHGDGFIDLTGGTATLQTSTNTATDGDDYMEGGGGKDSMFGGLGQDDLIGGSSDLFGLTTPSQRPDDADLIFGGNGNGVGRNHAGDTTDGGHARDADVILGDNGDIFRIVATNGGGTAFRTFNYDNYSGTLRIIPRAFKLLDYTPGGAPTDLGAGDLLHGEAGDDTMHGMTGNDTLFGEGQDDDLYGGVGNDWMSGGTGDDGMLGDDGKIFTSRNGTAEPLYAIAATTEQALATPGNVLVTTLNPTGRLTKSVDLEPFDKGGSDTMYGGLGNDSLHGGAGDDGLSGAEALPGFYNNPPYGGGDPATTPGIQFNTTTGDFTFFNDTTPLAKIAGHILNFEAADGGGTKIDDGQDVLFGDDGNDWLVGGTNSDHLYGGKGNDILNADDNLETSTTDAAPFADADTAYGGGGRDTLIANSGNDRLIDWIGEFNAYVTPFAPFGTNTVNREIAPAFPEFLYAISKSDGADQTRVGPGLGTADRNGEPFGELGLFLQQDPGFHDQIGGPADPESGNTPGKKK
ncbi:MAG: hypothetical protein AUH29_14540, partial [Candidatus Rokubacteria bacterium 13_1_40CM_69_27]